MRRQRRRSRAASRTSRRKWTRRPRKRSWPLRKRLLQHRPWHPPIPICGAAPDTQSNVLGMLLILPLLALLYTAIVAISGQRHVVPSILSSIQGMIWYIVGGLAFVSVLIFGASFVMGGERTKTAAPKKVKEPKVKAAKAEKPAKEKAPKAERAAEKPANEKKGFSLFGKKKEKK